MNWLPKYAGILLMLCLAFGLRIHQLGSQSFWNDEGNSARLSERSIRLIIEGTASDVHPPLYYLGLSGWRRLAGDSEFGLRYFSAVAGILTVGFIARLGKQIRKQSGWAPVAVVSLSPPLIYYSQEARMYAWLGLWAVASTAAFIAILQDSRPKKAVWLGYAAALAAGLYTHYFFPVVIMWQGVAICYFWLRKNADRRLILGLIGGMIAAVLSYLPWLPVFIRQSGVRGATGESFIDFSVGAGNWLLFGETFSAGWQWLMFAALLVLGMWALWQKRDSELEIGIITLLAIFVPIGVQFAAGATSPQFYKFLTITAPFIALLAGWIWSGFARARVGRLAELPILGGILWFSTLSLQGLYSDPAYARADYRGMAARIEELEGANAGIIPDIIPGIILDAPNQWEVFTYYYPKVENVYPLPRSAPIEPEIAAELSEIAGKHQRLFALFWGEAERDPQRLVERWLDANAYKTTEEWVGDVRFVAYAVPATPPQEPDIILNLPFGDQIELVGFALNQTEMSVSDIAQITLFWRANQPIQHRYKVFLHMVDQEGNIIVQRDSEPGGGLTLTTTWQPNEIIIDKHGILMPASASPGVYTLLLGLYDITEPTQRLKIAGNSDVYPISEMILK